MAVKKEEPTIEKNWMTGKPQEKDKAALEAASKPAALAVSEVGELRSYIVGLSDECPLDFITIPTIPGQGGAFTFAKTVQEPYVSGEGMYALGGPKKGSIIEIYDIEHQRIVEYLKNYGFKRTGSNPEDVRPEIVPLKPKEGQVHNWREVAKGAIEPLAKYAFIVAAREVTAENKGTLNRPPTLLEVEQTPVASK